MQYVELTRSMKIGAGATVTVGLECTVPYRNYTAWVHVGQTATLSVQPKFGGVNDGSAVAVTAIGPKKVYQVAVDEIRPSTKITGINPGDVSAPPGLVSELAITNSGGTEVTVGVYMIAITPGGM
jgi:hypothetical protein